jgi:carbonic anhydrase
LQQRGDFTLRSGLIEPQILNNKLRLKLPRRPCREINLVPCSEPDPPQADFPNDWGGNADAIHIDFKIPSEHLINGERFDAEMQIYHIHPSRRRVPTIVSLMRASLTGYNSVLQDIIDHFQYIFDLHASQCTASSAAVAQNVTLSSVNLTTTSSQRSGQDSTTTSGGNSQMDDGYSNRTLRQMQHYIFSPYHEMLMPSIYFFAYDGSLTEPPCSEVVTWFISDIPMQMSYEQLEQLKRIQFDHVDPYCRRTSIHYQESNARPIQDTFGRPVRHCTVQNFLPDADIYGATGTVNV